jgi:hypothetical protein
MMNKIFNLTFALAAALMSSPVAVSAYTTSDFDRGFAQGQQAAQNIWKHKDGGNCAHISDLEYQVKDYIQTHFWWHSSDSAFTKSFDKGGQAGMKNVLQQYQTQCHNDHHDNDDVNVDTGMCSGLGKDAASEIAEKYAEDHCPNYSRPPTSIFQKKYKEECFEIGLDDCKGAINDDIYRYCGRYIDDYSVLEGLKFKCGYKVSGYIDDSLH